MISYTGDRIRSNCSESALKGYFGEMPDDLRPVAPTLHPYCSIAEHLDSGHLSCDEVYVLRELINLSTKGPGSGFPESLKV